MAAADYRLCDICGHKTFYDSDLSYDFNDPDRPHGLRNTGDWAVICIECAETHEVVIKEK